VWNVIQDVYTVKNQLLLVMMNQIDYRTKHANFTVPILVTLKNYVKQPNVWASCNQAQFDDGRWNSLALCNPLGNKSDSKMSAFYFLVGNLET
jgi:hypothetical protein